MTIFIRFQWLTGRSHGRFRGTRASRFGANMGGETRPVKWTSVDGPELRPPVLRVSRAYFSACSGKLGGRGCRFGCRSDGFHLGVRPLQKASVFGVEFEFPDPLPGLAI